MPLSDVMFASAEAVRLAESAAKRTARAHAKAPTARTRQRARIAANTAAIAWASHTQHMSPETDGWAIRANIANAHAWTEAATRLADEAYRVNNP